MICCSLPEARFLGFQSRLHQELCDTRQIFNLSVLWNAHQEVRMGRITFLHRVVVRTELTHMKHKVFRIVPGTG